MGQIEQSLLESMAIAIEETSKDLKFDYTKRGLVTSVAADQLSCTVEIDGAETTCKILTGATILTGDVVLVNIIRNNFSDKYVVGKLGANLSESGVLTIKYEHYFADTTERDNYFITNPSELENGVYVVVGSMLQQYQVDTWVDLSPVIKGPKGDKGDKGDTGATGTGLEYDWNDTALGVKLETEPTFTYVELKGEKGDTGDPTTPHAYLHAEGESDYLDPATIGAESLTNKDQPNGYAGLDSNAKVPLALLPDTTKQMTHVVLDETERLALMGLIEGDKAFETSTGDSYIWNGTSWVLMADADWQNVSLEWDNIINKPLTFPPSTHTHDYLPLTGGTVTGNVNVVGALEQNGSAVWTAANDGPGSGLNADLLDGKQAGEFANFVHAHTLDDITETTDKKILTATEREKLDSVEWYANNLNSAGIVDTFPVITDNQDGTFDIGSCYVALYDNPNHQGYLTKYFIPAQQNLSTPADRSFYVVADYNSGNPIYRITEVVDEINESNIVPVLTVYNELDQELHFIEWDALGSALSNKIHKRLVKTQRFGYESGLAIGETDTPVARTITITGGTIWIGAVEKTHPSYNSSTHGLAFWYKQNGVWTKSYVTQYNNSQYQGPLNLQNLNPNKYTVNWIYKDFDDDPEADFVLGTESYGSVELAAAASPPTDLPPYFEVNAFLVGRIIVGTGALTAARIDSSFGQTFVASPVTDHNQLSNLQGGIAGERYHLTAAQVVKLDGVESGATADQTAQEIFDAVKTLDGATSGLDADLLDGQHGTHYLDWNNTTNKPSPSLTISGDATGIATFNSLTSTTLALTIHDDSHNHIISNVDGLQAALDSKLDLSGGTMTGDITLGANSVFGNSVGRFLNLDSAATLSSVSDARVIADSDQSSATEFASLEAGLNNLKVVSGAGSLDQDKLLYNDNVVWHAGNDGSDTGLNADLLDGQHGSYYTNASNINAGTIDDAYLPATISSDITGNSATATKLATARTISLSGDVSGSVSFDGSGNVNIVSTVADDSHNHIIGNVDGLAAALDSKLNASIYTAQDVFDKVKTLDGPGSGLDADLLDGLQNTQFVRNDVDTTITSKLNWNKSGEVINIGGSILNSTDAWLRIGNPTYYWDLKYVGTGVGPGGDEFRIESGNSGRFIQLDHDGNFEWSDSVNIHKIWHGGNDGSGSTLDADLLDGQHGSHYLDWANTTSKPSPTITLDGDVSGSLTLTELAGGILTVTIADDSHNHIIDNVDGLQTALDSKLNASSYTAADVLAKLLTVDGSGSTLDADRLDGQDGSYYLDWINVTNKPDPTITLAGDLSGSVTLTDLESATLTAQVADNSHAHTVANVTGLQTALDGKTDTGHTHLATEITEDSTHRFVTDSQITQWNSTAGLELGETSDTAYRGDRGKIAYDFSQQGGAVTGDIEAPSFTTGNFEIKHNATSDTLDFNYIG
jgi:hypothetical protein